LYRNKLLADCGSPTDPIEVMLIEQLALAHLNMGLLHCKASNAGSVECATAYSGAASRLMGEFRRSAIALQAYRAASRHLGQTPQADLVIPVDTGTETESGKMSVASEVAITPEEDDEEPGILPFRRTVSV
jgi:hypothetical protein